jgi:hypothetical protein
MAVASQGGSLGVSVITDPGPPPTGGARVVYMVPGGAGEAAGMQLGDLVVELDGRPFDPAAGDPATQFRQRLRDRPVGNRVSIVLERQPLRGRVLRDGVEMPDPAALLEDLQPTLDRLPEGGRLQVEASRTREVLRLDVALGVHLYDLPPVRPVLRDEETHARLLAAPASPLERLARRLVDEAGIADDTADLWRRLAALHASDDGFRRDDVRFVHRNPLRIPEASRDLLDALAPRTAQPDLAILVRAAAARDRADVSSLRFTPLPRDAALEEHVEAIARVLDETAALRAEAFAGLDAEERRLLADGVTGLGEALQDGIYLHVDEKPSRRRQNLRFLATAAKVRRDALYRAALSWARLADPAWIDALRRAARARGDAARDVVLRRSTPHGEIVVGGTGRNVWRDVEPAVLLELGGDDVHANAAGGSRWDARPAAAVIELGGDDAYESTDELTQGAGGGGVGLLVDVAGDDRHVSRRWSQAVGLLGVGALIDLEGDDTYRIDSLGEAAAVWGAAFLVDVSGDDRHDARVYSQGFGMPGGVAVLRDMGGDDTYVAKGGPPTSYGTKGVFDAWSQGCSMGFRSIQSGGIGMLVDDAGSDDYEAGNFAQGGGYYFGWGLLEDRGREADSYVGSRYDQGFSAHQAAGTFIEGGGDDRYVTRDGVIAGLAWDECVTYFHDAWGDDTYDAGGFSLGASAHNSLAIFVDASGSDAYVGTPPGRAGGNDYHGGTSLSLFLDLGRGRDRAGEGFTPRGVATSPEHSIVLDDPRALSDQGQRTDAGGRGRRNESRP